MTALDILLTHSLESFILKNEEKDLNVTSMTRWVFGMERDRGLEFLVSSASLPSGIHRMTLGESYYVAHTSTDQLIVRYSLVKPYTFDNGDSYDEVEFRFLA